MGFSKQCPKCGKVKWWYRFGIYKMGVFGLKSYCKACRSICDKKCDKKHHSKTPEEIRAIRSERRRLYRKNNPEKVRERERQRRLKNKEKKSQYNRKYRIAHNAAICFSERHKTSIPEARVCLNQKSIFDSLELINNVGGKI